MRPLMWFNEIANALTTVFILAALGLWISVSMKRRRVISKPEFDQLLDAAIDQIVGWLNRALGKGTVQTK